MFATRTPCRPNPVSLTLTRLISRAGCRLKLKGIDADNNTPVLDIKPYTRKDSIQKFKMPSWVKLLDKR
ncbi:TrmO family methyltransferase [Elusimicrobiota bacterium]